MWACVRGVRSPGGKCEKRKARVRAVARAPERAHAEPVSPSARLFSSLYFLLNAPSRLALVAGGALGGWERSGGKERSVRENDGNGSAPQMRNGFA